ncbi:PX domain protein [Metarhizium robertsii]|uniref:Endosomal/vacuolar adapter protein YPT35 n=1 Tax=Metarhizium robertsii TaxID=568076 RepID=A0A0A1URH4_9HYPO|nr:PX domain protein [Metarhizium robertsii]
MASAVDQEQPVSGSHPDDETPALGFPTVDSDAATAPSSHKAQTLDDDDHVPQDTEDMMSSTLSNSSVASPPYWMNTHAHQRNTSSVSVESVLPAGAIILQDNDTSEHQDRNNACWAKSVEVVNYTVVNGGATSVGAFVVWNVRVETLSGSYMNIRKRYSEFDEFRSKLVKSFPGFEGAVPSLPPKSVISKFRPNFLEKRRTGLQYFLK